MLGFAAQGIASQVPRVSLEDQRGPWETEGCGCAAASATDPQSSAASPWGADTHIKAGQGEEGPPRESAAGLPASALGLFPQDAYDTAALLSWSPLRPLQTRPPDPESPTPGSQSQASSPLPHPHVSGVCGRNWFHRFASFGPHRRLSSDLLLLLLGSRLPLS